MIKDFYHRYLRKYKLFRSVSFLLKRVQYALKYGYRKPARRDAEKPRSKLSELRVAVIADDMTWENLNKVCTAFYLTPDNWMDILEQEKPDVFFCEAAWQGLAGEGYCWDGQIFRNRTIWGENRFALKKILAYCQAASIPTVFWNKEDPFSDSEDFCFTDTALLFDHVCTTAEERISFYRSKGKESVHLLPMGFSPELFYPLEEPGEEDTAVFFGSWYEKYPDRCRDAEQIFDMVLSMGMKLTIYDRCFGTDIPERSFPEKYRPYIRPSVPYREIREELKKYRYAININTETRSETMFARRVLELMACGRLIISNESKALRKMFPGGIWFAGESFDLKRAEERVRENQSCVLKNHTFEHHMSEFFKDINLLTRQQNNHTNLYPK